MLKYAGEAGKVITWVAAAAGGFYGSIGKTTVFERPMLLIQWARLP